SKFNNLEVLILNNTKIKGSSLKELASLTSLRSVALSGTDISATVLQDLGKNKTLREIFIWNTDVTEHDVENLKKTFPYIHWDIGYIPDENEILKLNVPMLGNRSQVLNQDEEVAFRHNLPGTVIRYAVNENDPDSIKSPVYKDPLPVQSYAIIKTKAFKDGWLSSDIAEFVLFRKGYHPDTVLLLTQADEKYKGEGGITLIDENKGLPDFYRHPAWIGFMENDLVANFIFEKNTPTIRNITLSYVRNPNAIFMPPAEMQVWGGNDPEHLELIKKVNPPQPNGYNKTRIEGVSIDLPPTNFKFYRLVAKPFRKLELENPKKRNVWLMVDEVFFN
ncbi:MAG: FN3 associated domain-containing protein, partial [Cyclobacteriaceae bacterium]